MKLGGTFIVKHNYSGSMKAIAAASALLLLAVLFLLYPASSESEEGGGYRIDPAGQPENTIEYVAEELPPRGPDAAQQKFDGGFYSLLYGSGDLRVADGPWASVRAQLGASADGYHAVVIVVVRAGEDGLESDETAARNKESVARKLEGMGAHDIFVAQSLSFLTASVPVQRIAELSLLDEVLQLGDGEAQVVPAIGQLTRGLIGVTGADLAGLSDPPLNGSGVVVAVLDTGINGHYLNDRVIGRSWCDDCEFRGGLIYGNATENIDHLNRTSTSHGTQVAHVIAASGHGDADGIAPGVSLLDAMYGSGTSHTTFRAAFVQMMDWAHTNGADVINISSSTGKCYNNLASIYTIVTETVNKGTVVVSSGGNEPGFQQISYPACVPSVIAVGGLNSLGTNVWNGAAQGPSSYDSPRLLPHVIAPAQHISVASFTTESPQIVLLGGTSLSSPMVSAAAALLLQQDGNLENRWRSSPPCSWGPDGQETMANMLHLKHCPSRAPPHITR